MKGWQEHCWNLSQTFQLRLSNLAKILSGDEDTLLDTVNSLPEEIFSPRAKIFTLFLAKILYQFPYISVNDVGYLFENVLEIYNMSLDSDEDPLMRIIHAAFHSNIGKVNFYLFYIFSTKIIEGNTRMWYSCMVVSSSLGRLITTCSQTSKTQNVHNFVGSFLQLIINIFRFDEISLRDQLILDYVTVLMSYQNLWPICVTYLKHVESKGRKQYLERVLSVQSVDTDRQAWKVIHFCNLFEFHELKKTVYRAVAARKFKSGMHGEALDWLVQANDLIRLAQYSNYVIKRLAKLSKQKTGFFFFFSIFYKIPSLL